MGVRLTNLRSGISAWIVALSLAAALAMVILPSFAIERAGAAFPGENGRVAFGGGTSEWGVILTANPDGSDPRKLVEGAGVNNPTYSPDGSRMVFESWAGTWDVETVGADGSGRRMLIDNPTGTDSSETSWDTDHVHPESGEVIPFVKVNTHEERWDLILEPAFSPDGSELVAVHHQGVLIRRTACEVDELGSEECLPPYSDSGWEVDSQCECWSNLVTVDSTSGALTGTITAPTTRTFDGDPVLSADGKLAFVRRDEASGIARVFVIPSPGSSPFPVSPGPFDEHPDFSPDGARIVFDVNDAFAVQGEVRLGIVGALGGPVSIIRPPTSPTAVPGYDSLRAPSFSPDGSRLLFDRFHEGSSSDRGLFSTALDGTGALRVAAGSTGAPAWQPLPAGAPRPPRVIKRARAIGKKRVRLDRQGRGTMGWLICGSARCKPKVLSVRLSVGGRIHPVRGLVPRRLAAGRRARLRVKVAAPVLAALRRGAKRTLSMRIRPGVGQGPLRLRATVIRPSTAKKSPKAR